MQQIVLEDILRSDPKILLEIRPGHIPEKSAVFLHETHDIFSQGFHADVFHLLLRENLLKDEQRPISDQIINIVEMVVESRPVDARRIADILY